MYHEQMQLKQENLRTDSGLNKDSHPWPLRCGCSALPTELSSQLGATVVIAWICNYLLMPNLHFTKLAPHTGQVIYFTVVHFGGFIEDHSGLGQLTVLFIKLSKLHPQRMRFAWRQLWFHSLNCLGVCVDDFFWFSLIEFHPFMPFMDIVGVLTQKHTKKRKENSKIKIYGNFFLTILMASFRKIKIFLLAIPWT